ncbi:uncharacterized protein EV154DRAFT_476685 [Mucor mucedo]|uniref:uncharacterized protein n=1 Tax=Mucor mucedo TaxID=29922 RepID=UPI00221F10DE|nr:uncharacterized protein EV154DRAFT_476685 [Mucor mucedo]KAI7896320.1 hypothetical protein EV154DRAFT_476685 [Mucor mucedo]
METTLENQVNRKTCVFIIDDIYTGETELMGPSRLINHLHNLLKLLTVIENVQVKCHIAISNMPLSLMPLSLLDVLNNNGADQKALQVLGKFPNVLKLLKGLMASDARLENFPLDVWQFKSKALARGSMKSNFFSTIGIILTDFWGLFQRIDLYKSHGGSFGQITLYGSLSISASSTKGSYLAGKWLSC